MMTTFPEEMSSNIASLYLFDATREPIDWRNLLAENRRAAVSMGKPKGNRHRWGAIPYYRKGNKVFYLKQDLFKWVEAYKLRKAAVTSEA